MDSPLTKKQQLIPFHLFSLTYDIQTKYIKLHLLSHKR